MLWLNHLNQLTSVVMVSLNQQLLNSMKKQVIFKFLPFVKL